MLSGHYTHKGDCENCGDENVRLYIEIKKQEPPKIDYNVYEEYGIPDEQPIKNGCFGTLFLMLIVSAIYYMIYINQNN